MDQLLMKMYLKLQAGFSGLREHEENGATAVEYALLVALIAAVVIGVVGALGLQVQATFQSMADAMP